MPSPRLGGPGRTEVDLERAIAGGLERMRIQAPTASSARLAAYLALLARWNRVYNLTAVRRPEDMVGRHVLDSLSILPWLRGPRVVDVGSGAGLPGIPLAVVRPEVRFCLLDGNGKRTRFLTQAVLDLGLENVEVVRSRAEDYDPRNRFASVVSRAFGSLAEMLRCAGHLCAPDGRVLAMKGALPEAELAVLPAGYRLAGVYRLQEGLDAERHLVHLEPDALSTQA